MSISQLMKNCFPIAFSIPLTKLHLNSADQMCFYCSYWEAFIIPHYINVCDMYYKKSLLFNYCHEHDFVFIAQLFFLYSIQIHKKITNSRTFFFFVLSTNSKVSNSNCFRRKACPSAPRLLGPSSEFGSNETDVSKFIKRVCEYQATLAFNIKETEHLMKFAYIDPTTQR